MAKHSQLEEEKEAVRLDKWLWAARFYKPAHSPKR